MILDKEVQMKVNSRTVKKYKNKGYQIPMRMGSRGKMVFDDTKYFTVKIEDVEPNSTVLVNTACDICGDKKIMRYCDYMPRIAKDGLRTCVKCKTIKFKNTLHEKYGEEISNVTQLDHIKEKIKATNREKFGVDWCMSNKECQEKRRNTFIEKYGHECSFGSKDIYQKGIETKYKNGNVATSVQQKYICNLYNGKLNYPCSNYNLDIIVDNIDIEYDGGGHSLSVELGNISQHDFDVKQIVRDKIVKSYGYKIIRLISHTDKLPSDDILLKIFDLSKEYFLSTNHSWIEWYFDENTYRNANNCNGAFFDFGILRKLKTA